MANWTRNQKIAVWGIIIASILAITGMIVKINIDINYIKDDIKNITIKNAEIDTLKTRVAEIDKLLAGDTSVGRFKSTCPPGTSATTVVTPNGFEVECH